MTCSGCAQSFTYIILTILRGRYCFPHLTEEEAEAQKCEVICAKGNETGTSLVAQWLRLCTPNTGGPGSVPGRGTRVHMPQLEILHDAAKTRCS